MYNFCSKLNVRMVLLLCRAYFSNWSLRSFRAIPHELVTILLHLIGSPDIDGIDSRPADETFYLDHSGSPDIPENRDAVTCTHIARQLAVPLLSVGIVDKLLSNGAGDLLVGLSLFLSLV